MTPEASRIPEHNHAREEFTNIRVARDKQGNSRWFTGEKEIINHKVISHFKQHLFRDAKGIYIYQTFRQFAEKGYIKVEGPLLSVFRVDSDVITLDSLDTIPVNEVHVIQNADDEALYVFYPRLQCYAGVGASVAPDFAALIEEKDGQMLLGGKPIEKHTISAWC